MLGNTAMETTMTMPRTRYGAGRRWIVVAAIAILLVVGPTAAMAESPKFEPSMVEEVRALTRKAGIRHFYLLVAETSFPECRKLITWNSAAKRVYSAGRPEDYCVIEIGVNGLPGVNASLRRIGIEQGFVDHVLYESWPAKLVVPGTGAERTHQLIWEFWAGDTVGRATVK